MNSEAGSHLDKLFKRYFYGVVVDQTSPEIEYFETGKSFSLSVNNREVACYEFGEGEPILICHGLYSRASKLVLMIQKLVENGYKVIAFDVPGHGNSTGKDFDTLLCADIVEALTKIYPEINTIIAHSFGCTIIMFAIAAKKVYIDKFVAISPVEHWRNLLDKYISMHQLDDDLKDHFIDRFKGMYTEEQMNIFSPINAVKSFGGNLLLVHDERDEITPLTSSQNIMKSAADNCDVDLIVTNKLGHFFVFSNESVIDKIVSWIS